MTKWVDSNDEQVTQWWLERNPEPRDLRWRDLNDAQRVLLTAWYAMARMRPPEPTEGLPLEYSTILGELNAVTGQCQQLRFMRHRLQPGVAPNHRRRVRARKRHGQLA